MLYYKIDESILKTALSDMQKIDDIFFVVNKKTNILEKIFTKGDDILLYILKNRNPYKLREYLQFEVISFIVALKKDKCKFKSFNKKYTIYKYKYLLTLYNEKIINNKPLVSYLYTFQDIIHSKKAQKYFRKKKINILLDNNYI